MTWYRSTRRSRCRQESQRSEQRRERGERHRHTTTHLELEEPSCKRVQCKSGLVDTLGVEMQASPVQSSWVILCQLGALLQKCKAHGSFCANSEPSCKSAKLMGHSVPTPSPPASVSSAKVAWWTHLESRCKQESQQREQRSERSERHRHTTTHLEPSCKHLEPSCKHLQCKGSAKAAWWTHLQCKAHGSFCANSKPSCKSAKLMDHSVPTWSPPATVQSSWVILCQLGALLQASPVQKWPGGHTWSRDAGKNHNEAQHACMLAILHNPNPAVPVSRNTSPRNTSPRQAPRQRAHPHPETLRGNLGTCLGTLLDRTARAAVQESECCMCHPAPHPQDARGKGTEFRRRRNGMPQHLDRVATSNVRHPLATSAAGPARLQVRYVHMCWLRARRP
jgi:hypothetical protein